MFGPPAVVRPNTGIAQSMVRLGDIDGDGRLDYCYIAANQDLYCFRYADRRTNDQRLLTRLQERWHCRCPCLLAGVCMYFYVYTCDETDNMLRPAVDQPSMVRAGRRHQASGSSISMATSRLMSCTFLRMAEPLSGSTNEACPTMTGLG